MDLHCLQGLSIYMIICALTEELFTDQEYDYYLSQMDSLMYKVLNFLWKVNKNKKFAESAVAPAGIKS